MKLDSFKDYCLLASKNHWTESGVEGRLCFTLYEETYVTSLPFKSIRHRFLIIVWGLLWPCLNRVAMTNRSLLFFHFALMALDLF